MIEANNPDLKSWIDVPSNSDFPIQNIPFGVGRVEHGEPHVCTRIGDTVIDLHVLAQKGFLSNAGIDDYSVLNHKNLNPLFALGRKKVGEFRSFLSKLFRDDNGLLRDNEEVKQKALISVNAVEMLLPVKPENYTDFYSSEEHATNIGTMFRGKENALMPNWKHLPVGYHGRTSSITVSGTSVRRPKGQTKPNEDEGPKFGPCKLLDFELEMAFITCKENELGDPIPMQECEDHIIGMVIFNDWSARDIQKWEYVPLGPFLAKSWASTVSPWVVTMDALEPFRTDGPVQEPEVLPYLQFSGKKNYDIKLDVFIQPEGGEEKQVTRSNFKYMYWNMCQQLAHQTVNGCNVQVGDMYASGTISGPTSDSYGSMLELTWRGSKPIEMPDGTERKFLHDGDTVKMRGFAANDKVRIGFGEVSNKILPAK